MRNRIMLFAVFYLVICNSCKKDVNVKFDKETFVEQKQLWQASNTKDYKYDLRATGFLSYYGKIIVENGSFNKQIDLQDYSESLIPFFPDYSTIDSIYKTIEGVFNSSNDAIKSDFYFTEISVEYDKINHIPIKINYRYYCSPRLAVDGTFNYTIANFDKQ